MMPDASQLIRDDHTRVKDLFREFEKAEDARTKQAIAEATIGELRIHTALEEEIFYPVVRRRKDADELIDEAEEEHHVVDLLADEIERLPPSDPQIDAKFAVLAENVKHHIDQEELVMLPKASELGLQELQRLGEKMAEMKERLIMEGRPVRRQQTRKGATGTKTPRSSAKKTAKSTAKKTVRSVSTRAKSAKKRISSSTSRRKAA
jgi:hypothetical protein